MNYLIILLLCFSNTNQHKPITEVVDKIEINTNSRSSPITQIIFYEWSPEYKRHHVMAWLLFKESFEIDKDKKTIKFYDRIFKRDRIIKSKVFIYSNTGKIDPEIENKKIFPEKYRIGLYRESVTR